MAGGTAVEQEKGTGRVYCHGRQAQKGLEHACVQGSLRRDAELLGCTLHQGGSLNLTEAHERSRWSTTYSGFNCKPSGVLHGLVHTGTWCGETQPWPEQLVRRRPSRRRGSRQLGQEGWRAAPAWIAQCLGGLHASRSPEETRARVGQDVAQHSTGSDPIAAKACVQARHTCSLAPSSSGILATMQVVSLFGNQGTKASGEGLGQSARVPSVTASSSTSLRSAHKSKGAAVLAWDSLQARLCPGLQSPVSPVLNPLAQDLPCSFLPPAAAQGQGHRL